jgi:nucleotide-binding universal stress UspA family protein
MPILSKADEINVMVDPHFAKETSNISALFSSLKANLNIHCPVSRFSVQNDGMKILDNIHRVDADLLIMNACAKPAWPTPILYGSATEFILKHSDIPIVLGR